MPLNYSFFSDQGETPATLQERRLKADMLASQIGRDNTYGGGIGDLFRGLGAGLSRYRTGQAQKKGEASAKTGMDRLMETIYAPKASPTASNDDVKKTVLTKLAGMGYTPAQIAGIAGNLQQESGFDPDILGDNGASFGIAQWQGPRRVALEQFAAERGADPADPELQAEFMHHEMQTTERGAGDALRAATTPEEATNAFLGFERPQGYTADNPAGAHGYANRQANAMAMVPQLATYTPPQPQMAGAPMGQPPQMPVQAPPPADPAQPMAPAQQAAAAQMQPAGNDAALIPQIMEVLRNPFISDQDRAFLQQRLEDIQKKQDPAYQMEFEKSQLELDALRNPGPDYEIINGKDGSVFRVDKRTGKTDTLYGPQPDQVKPTADIQEYEYAKQQGFKGSFQDFQIEQKRAGASQVNIDQKAEGAFDKKLAEGQAEAFNTMATEGLNARADLGVINELEANMANSGGTLSGLAGIAAKYGIGGEGMSDIQAAQALIAKLVPTQRQPGSGSMSDRDVELFTRSLPSLWNTPGGNAKIINVMRGLAAYKQAQGEIADQVMMGEISRQEARKRLRELPNPLAEEKKKVPVSGKTSTGVPIAPVDNADPLGIRK